MCRRETNGAPVFQQHWQQSQYPWQSVCPPSLQLHSSLSLPLVSSVLRKRKTNSFPYKWSESLQPRDPVELQIFHLCLGAVRFYSLAIIPFLSFFFFYFLSLLCSHTGSPLLSTHAYVDPFYIQLSSISQNHHSNKRKKTSSYIIHSIIPIHSSPSDLISVQQKITLLQSWTQFKLPIQSLQWSHASYFQNNFWS